MMERLRQFVADHFEDDTMRLVLDRDKWQGIDVDMAVNSIEARRKVRSKLPSWYLHAGIIYPSRLCAEQCSSEETAGYKASVLSRVVGEGFKVADLTGGLGVDSVAFAGVASEVLYNEMNPSLAAVAPGNFAELGVNNIVVHSQELSAGSLGEILGDFRPDVIFLDPARRASDGRKVFLLEDCSPDVLKLKDDLLAAAPFLFLKLSPMADISMAVGRLGNVKEVHVVAYGGDCKELLLLLERGYDGAYSMFVNESGEVLAVPSDKAVPRFLDARPLSGEILFEPRKAMAKSGASDFICDSLGAKKLGRHTNLYVVSDQIGQTIDAGRPKASLLSRGSCSQASSGLTANSSFLVADAPNGRQTHAVTRRRPLTCSTLRRHSKSLNLSAYSTSSWYKSFTIIEVAKMGNAAFKEFHTPSQTRCMAHQVT